MTATTYELTLRSARWFALKWRRMVQTDFRCERCGRRYVGRKHKRTAMRYFNLHHRHYLSVGREDFDDVELLCRPCHQREHNIP